MNDLTPTERLALVIEDLKAQLELANERTFFIASQNARLRAVLTDMRNDCIANGTTGLIMRVAEILLEEPPYPNA
jgi:hypothetical protein